MKTVEYLLRTRSIWSTGQVAGDDYRLVGFDVTAERGGLPVGGHNVQAVIGAPGMTRHGLDRDVALWLASGWWVSLRNQFKSQPELGAEILTRASGELEAITVRLGDSTGATAVALWQELHDLTVRSSGQDYWRS